MTRIEDLISTIESQWETIAIKAIAQAIAESPTEQFYAAGFWLFYCDYTVIHPPCFGMNTESHLVNAGEDAKYERWTPPNWEFDVLDGTTDLMMPHYAPLHEDHDEETWEQIMEDHKHAIARVCRRITAAARSSSGPFESLAVPSKFVVGIFEHRDGDEEYDRLAELSMEPAVLSGLDVPIG